MPALCCRGIVSQSCCSNSPPAAPVAAAMRYFGLGVGQVGAGPNALLLVSMSASASTRRSGPAAPAPAFAALVSLTIEGANINTRFRTALPCSLAFRDSVRFALIATDAGIDIDAAIGRTCRRTKRNRKRDTCYQCT